MALRRVAALTLILLLPSCGGSEGPGAVGDAEGLAAPDRILEWAPEPVYTVGGFEAPDWATFGGIADVGFDEEGNLYLLDRQTAQVTQVSPRGEFIRTIGRRGDGPGELGTPFGMEVLPDGRVVLPDMAKRALVVYDAQGEWLHNVRVDLAREGLPTSGLNAVPSGGLLAAEALWIGRNPSGDGEDTETGAEPDHRSVWWYPVAEGDTARLLHRAWNPPPPPEGGGSTLEAGGEGRSLMLRMDRVQAFEPGLHVAALAGGRLALVDSTDYTVKILSDAGEVEDRLYRPVEPTPVTDEIREIERSRRLDEIAERQGSVRLMGGGSSFSVNEEAMKRMLEDQVANMAFYPEIPVVEALAADPLGRIWVQRSSGVPGRDGPTDLITADGRYIGTLPPDGIRIPDAFGPDGLAAYVELDDFDVASVRVVRLPNS